jgi:hypothetical protein
MSSCIQLILYCQFFFYSGMVNSLFGSKYFRSNLIEVTSKQILYNTVIQSRTMKMKEKVSVKINRNSKKEVTKMQLHHLAVFILISKEGFLSDCFHVKGSNLLYYCTIEYSLSLH